MKHALLPIVALICFVVGGACSGAKDRFAGDGGGAPGSCAVLDAGGSMRDYGTISIGDPSPPVPITVTNTGSCPSGVLATAIAGQDAVSFGADTDACKGQALQPGASCVISTHFVPMSSGAKTATLTVAGGPGEAASVVLTGTGAPITLLPTMQDYGTVVVGSSSVPTTFTLTNGGITPTGIVKMAVLGGDQEQFVAQRDTCSGKPLDPTKSCTVDVTFTAAGNGTKMATLTATIAGVATARSTLSGFVAGGAAFVVTPPTYDFGSVTAPAITAPTSFVVKNIGQVASGVPAVAGSDPSCPHFRIVNTCTAGLPAAGSCMFTVAYAPPAPTNSSEACALNVTAPQTLSATVKVAGFGLTPAALQSKPPTHDFGDVLQGTTSTDFTFLITNTGMSTTTALGVSLSGTNASQFGISSDTCGGKQLAGSATCTVAVHFSPNANSFGLVQAQLLVQGAVGGIDSIGVQGHIATPASIAIGPNGHGFGTHEIGTSSDAFTFTVTNSGTLPSGPPNVTLSGSGDFVKGGRDSCSGVPIPGNFASCTVDVIYRPFVHGPVAGKLTVSANPGGVVSSALSGTGATRPALQITGPGDFGTVTVQTTSGTNTFVVRNNGETRSGALHGALINGPNAGDFHITADNCIGQQLGGNGGNACTVSVSFSPSNANVEQANLNEDDGQGAMTNLGLRGTGIPACPTTCPNGDNCGTYTPPMAGCAQINCGTCTLPNTCGGGNPSNPNVCGCFESDADFCAGKNAQCGAVSGTDKCGKPKTVASCGPCTPPNKCGEGNPGTPNVCGCTKATTCPATMCSGTAPDGCGGTVLCTDQCKTPQSCGGGGVPNQCGCTSMCPTGQICGSVADTCNPGKTIDCGPGCKKGQACSGGTSCCASLDGNSCCASPDNGLTCCPTSASCQAGTCGTITVAGCAPVTCSCAGMTKCVAGMCMACMHSCSGMCSGSDGCTGMCSIADCSMGQVCNNGACCTKESDPQFCANANACGSITANDNCGVTRTVACGCGPNAKCVGGGCVACTHTCNGICAGSDTCNGTCAPNDCSMGQVCNSGACCTPATTCPMGQNCGTASDGCGGTVNCGNCTFPQICGGGGTPGVCGP